MVFGHGCNPTGGVHYYLHSHVAAFLLTSIAYVIQYQLLLVCAYKYLGLNKMSKQLNICSQGSSFYFTCLIEIPCTTQDFALHVVILVVQGVLQVLLPAVHIYNQQYPIIVK